MLKRPYFLFLKKIEFFKIDKTFNNYQYTKYDASKLTGLSFSSTWEVSKSAVGMVEATGLKSTDSRLPSMA